MCRSLISTIEKREAAAAGSIRLNERGIPPASVQTTPVPAHAIHLSSPRRLIVTPSDSLSLCFDMFQLRERDAECLQASRCAPQTNYSRLDDSMVNCVSVTPVSLLGNKMMRSVIFLHAAPTCAAANGWR